MKKPFLILLLLILAITAVNSQFTKIGGGLAASTGFHFNNESGTDHRSGILGASLKGIYEITLPIHISPSFTFMIPHITKTEFVTGPESSVRVSSMMVDINGHYVFNSLSRFEFYALTGLDINFASIRWKSVFNGETFKSGESDNVIGLNLGAGTYFKLTDQFDLYGEAKYILSRYDHFIFNLGVLINLDWLIKHENTVIN